MTDREWIHQVLMKKHGVNMNDQQAMELEARFIEARHGMPWKWQSRSTKDPGSEGLRDDDAESNKAFRYAMAILDVVRLTDREEEVRWAEMVIDHCHAWGDFYGPATSKHLARVIAHRYLDRQGGSAEHLRMALATYGNREDDPSLSYEDRYQRLLLRHPEWDWSSPTDARDAALEEAALRIEELRNAEGIGLDASFLAEEVRGLKTNKGASK